MKRILQLTAVVMILIFTLTGCGTIDGNTKVDTEPGSVSDVNNDDSGNDNMQSDKQPSTFQAEVIEAGDHLLITPDKDSNEMKSSDRIAVGLNQASITDEDGNTITAADLKPGDYLEITYDGGIAESYPAQISASEIQRTGHNMLLDGYLALIDDIWQEDDGLNGEIEMIALDTTGWVEVSEIEKEIIFAKLKEAYGYEIIEGTFDELVEQGLIDQDNLYFPKGVQIIISDMTYNADKIKITCAIQKWRSGLGAIGSDDVTAKYKDGKWVITKDGMWIS
jgi:hypothetical protein